MDRDAIIARLRASEAQLRARARGDNRPYSDIDIMIEMQPGARIGLFRYAGIVHAVEDMFPVRVDVSNREAQKSHVRPTADRDAIYVF